MNFVKLRESAARCLFESGSVSIDIENGFKLQRHREFPDAPLSPIYLSMRRKGVKTGKLSNDDMFAIGRAMAAKAQMVHLFDVERWVAGIPASGEPIADAMIASLSAESARNFRRFRLHKIETSGVGKIEGVEGLPSETSGVALFDDLVTSIETKFQAIHAVEENGSKVSDLLVFLDRSWDATEVLWKHRVTLHIVWEFEELMNFYLLHGYVNRRQHDAIMEYPLRLAAYIAEHT